MKNLLKATLIVAFFVSMGAFHLNQKASASDLGSKITKNIYSAKSR